MSIPAVDRASLRARLPSALLCFAVAVVASSAAFAQTGRDTFSGVESSTSTGAGSDECRKDLKACDSDRDGVPDAKDNCPDVANKEQTDTDLDGEGDACDADADNDAVTDADDKCEATPAGSTVNEQGCSGMQYVALTCADTDQGSYVACVTKAAQDATDAALLSHAQRGALVAIAAQGLLGSDGSLGIMVGGNGSGGTGTCTQNLADPANVLYSCGNCTTQDCCNKCSACKWVPEVKKGWWKRLFGGA